MMDSQKMIKDPRAPISHYDTITSRCTKIISGVWNLVCSGSYPMDALIRYRGKLVAEGEPYAVFQSEIESDDFLAVFRIHEIGFCKSLRIRTMNEFECTMRSGRRETIKIGHSHVVCVNYAFRLVDELVEHCTRARVGSNRFAALYYGNVEVVLNKLKSGCGLALGSNILVLIVSAIFLVVVVLHWR